MSITADVQANIPREVAWDAFDHENVSYFYDWQMTLKRRCMFLTVKLKWEKEIFKLLL